jgi:hypothetical protein
MATTTKKTISPKAKEKAFADGYQAAKRALEKDYDNPRRECPFVAADEPQKHEAWCAGWDKALGESPKAARPGRPVGSATVEEAIKWLQAEGVQVTDAIWAKLDDDDIRAVMEWADGRKAGRNDPVPLSMRRFHEEWLAEEDEDDVDETGTPSDEQHGLPVQINVEWGGVSVGDATARLGCAIERGELGMTAFGQIGKAERLFCERRLTVECDTNDGQKRLPGMDDSLTISGSVDVKAYRVTRKAVGLSLTFQLSGIDVGTLAQLAKRSGRLTINHIEDVSEKDGDDHDHGDDDDEPATVPMPQPSQKKMYFEVIDVQDALSAHGLTLADDVIEQWSDEQRHAVIAWAEDATPGGPLDRAAMPECLRQEV